MSLTYRETDSGFVVAEEAFDEARVSRALRQIDGRLALQFRPPYYVVVCRVSDHYAPVVSTWMDMQGRPLPLSSGLVEKVQMWRLGARNQPETVDEFNERRLDELRKDRERASAAIKDDYRGHLERGRTQVTFADVEKPRYWKREGTVARSGRSK